MRGEVRSLSIALLQCLWIGLFLQGGVCQPLLVLAHHCRSLDLDRSTRRTYSETTQSNRIHTVYNSPIDYLSRQRNPLAGQCCLSLPSYRTTTPPNTNLSIVHKRPRQHILSLKVPCQTARHMPRPLIFPY